MHTRVIIQGLLTITALLLAGFILEHEILGISLDKDWIDHSVRGQGIEGELWFITAGALFTALGLPRQIVSFLAGYAFDVWLGTTLGLLATALGCLVIFYYARWWRRHMVIERFPERIDKVNKFISNNTFTMTLVLRLFPVGHNLFTNLSAGVSSVKFLPFFLGSLLGYLPQTLIFALLGSGISIDPHVRISVAIVGFIVSSLLGVYLYSKYRNDYSAEH